MQISIDANSIRPMVYQIPSVSTKLNFNDYLGTMKVRWGIGRDNYSIQPGLYKIGNPNSNSDVLVSANYKLSFDMLRKNLESLDAWILVIDTKGVNVWCAAGKGTFSTQSIVKEIKETSLENMVKHRKIIVPQLGAPGVAAHLVKEQSGFRVIYGPIRAKDIKPFIEAGYKATPVMRKMVFPAWERAKLIPVDFMYGKYKMLLIVATLFFLSGLDRTGFLFSKMIQTSPYPVINAVGAYFAGIVMTPLLLPYMPFRPFALKGAAWGLLFTILINLAFKVGMSEVIAIGFLNLAIASFLAMNFTGSSTYTSLSGVKKEMKWAIPFQIASVIIATILFIISKLL
jgi:hypothetical protein